MFIGESIEGDQKCHLHSPFILGADYSTSTFFITQADILENITVVKFSLHVYDFFPKLLIGLVGRKGVPNVKLLPSVLHLRIILLSKEIKAHFITSSGSLPSLQ